MYRILVTDGLASAGVQRLEAASDAEYELRSGLDSGGLRSIIGGYEALIVRSRTQVDASMLNTAGRLKVVGRAGTGVDNIDLAAAAQHGVIVMNTPGANSVATAEQTMALMLAVTRFTPQAHLSLLNGEWRRADFVGTELSGKVLGIVGLGRVGRLVAARALAFGMEVVASDPYVAADVGVGLGVPLLPLSELLEISDYVSLHAALRPETELLIDAAAIRQMKAGAILINTARGGLLDEEQLAVALRQGSLRAAAVDVYSNEPPQGSPLLGLKNVIHTPHLGASTAEAQRNIAVQIADQVLDALRGREIRNAVNLPSAAG